MKNSHIEWCDHTFNPWEGCTKVSPGCAHCYAEARNARFGGGTAPNWGPGAPRRRTSVSYWNDPRRWDREAQAMKDVNEHKRIVGEEPQFPTHRPRVFCASLADWLDDEVPAEWLRDLLDLVATTPNLDWLLLTKRPENWLKRIAAASSISTNGKKPAAGSRLMERWIAGEAPANVWLGTTVEDQVRADERVPVLLRIPAKVRFLSCEPLLGPVDLRQAHIAKEKLPRVDWVIVGGESGRVARPMHPTWARSIRNQCDSKGVPFLFKQWGEWADASTCVGGDWPVTVWSDGEISARVGKKLAGRELDGIEHNAFPEVRA